MPHMLPNFGSSLPFHLQTTGMSHAAIERLNASQLTLVQGNLLALSSLRYIWKINAPLRDQVRHMRTSSSLRSACLFYHPFLLSDTVSSASLHWLAES